MGPASCHLLWPDLLAWPTEPPASCQRGQVLGGRVDKLDPNISQQVSGARMDCSRVRGQEGAPR